MKDQRLTRRRFLRWSGGAAAATLLAACGPKVVEKKVEVPVEVTKVVVEQVTPTAAPAESAPPPATPTPSGEVLSGAVVDTLEAGQAAYGGYDEIHPSKEVSLLVWGIPGDENADPWVRAMKAGMKRFGEKYPEIKVTWEPIPWSELSTKVSAAIAARQGPDILFECDMEAQYPRNQVIRPITEEVLPTEFLRKHRFYEVRPVADGELYWVHCAVMAPHLFANRELLAKEGLRVSDVPTTWEEFGRFCQQLTKFENGQMVQAGFGFNGYSSLMWDDLVYQQKGKVYSPKKSHVNSPEGANAWQMLLDLYDRFKINDRNFLNYDEAFGAGKSAFMYCWTWITFSLEANYPNIDWAPVLYPTFTGEGPYARFDYDGPGWMVSTLAEGDRLPAAWELFKYHVHEYQFLVERSHSTGMMLATEPHPNYEKVFAEVQAIENPTQEQRRLQSLAVLYKQFEGGMVFPGEVQGPFYDMWNGMNDAILLNNRPVKEVLAEYESLFDEILAKTDFWITPEA